MDFRVVTTGLKFPEGPLELPNGDILVTEIAAGCLTRITPSGEKSVFAKTGGGPNGAAIGPEGAIFVAQNGGFHWTERPLPDGTTGLFPGEQPEDYIGGQIQRVSADGSEVTTIYKECDGERLKGPNDLVFDAEGNFYFTDHGKTRPRDRDRTGVFYASPDGKMIKEIVFPMEGPNGIGLSPDGKVLYVAETPTGARSTPTTLSGRARWACGTWSGPCPARRRSTSPCAIPSWSMAKATSSSRRS